MFRRLARRLTYAAVAAALLIAAAAAGCGDSSDESEKDADPSAAKPAGRSVPAELVGTYTMVLKPNDLLRLRPPTGSMSGMVAPFCDTVSQMTG